MTASLVLGSSLWDLRTSETRGSLFSIREFVYPEDYLAVIKLWEESGPGVQVRRSDRPEQIEKKLKRDPDLFLVAESDGRLVGSVLGGFDGRRGLVYHLAVSPAYQNKGMGAALMEELERRLQTMGCIRAYLLVTKDNEQAVRFYEGRGWERMEIFVYGKDLE
jgi:ribosomal protein S18 acetylase RimI-like enzyme